MFLACCLILCCVILIGALLAVNAPSLWSLRVLEGEPAGWIGVTIIVAFVASLTGAVIFLVAFVDRDDAPGTLTICKGQGLFLRADDVGLLMRNFHFGRARRIAWTEISHFADGRYTKEGVTSWALVIVPRTGKQVPVLCSVLAPVGEVVAAVRKAAQPHGIPADLTGVPMLRRREDPSEMPG